MSRMGVGRGGTGGTRGTQGTRKVGAPSMVRRKWSASHAGGRGLSVEICSHVGWQDAF